MAAAGGSFIAARSGNGCQEEKEEGSDRPRTLGRGVVSNGCSGLSNMSEGKL